jgi:hypothetical protein
VKEAARLESVAAPPEGPVDEGGQVTARGAFPPRTDGLGREAGRVGQQLGDGGVTHAGTGQVGVERVGEGEAALVAQPHDHDGDEGLGDRPDPVLHVGVGDGAVDPAAAAVPRQDAVADDTGDHRREALAGLLLGQPGGQQVRGPGRHHGRPGTTWRRARRCGGRR